MGECDSLQANQMWDRMTQEAPFFFSRDPSIYAVVHSPSCCSTGSEKQALNENQCQPGAQQRPIYPASQTGSTLHSKSCSAMTSCCQYPGSHLTVPRGDVCAVLCCGVWWGWDGGKHWGVSATHWLHTWLEMKSPPSVLFYSIPGSLWCSITIPLALQCWTGELPSDTGMMTWLYHVVRHNFLTLLWTTWSCSACAHWCQLGTMTWILQHWEEEWAETGSSPYCACPLSWQA